MNRKAMIFAAGLGTRLYPITADKPKALAEVNGITLLEHAINYLHGFGFDDIIINTHHFAEKVHEFVDCQAFENCRILLSHEDVLLDTAGGLKKAEWFFSPDDTILLFNVDILCNVDLNAMIDFHYHSKAHATLLVQNRETSRYLLFDENLHLQGWTNIKTGELKPNFLAESHSFNKLAFNGVHIINYEILKRIPEGLKLSLVPFYLDNLTNVSIQGYPMPKENFWFDCGRIETLEAATKYIREISI